MSHRILKPLLFGSLTLSALALSASVMAQTAPPAKAKPSPSQPASTGVPPGTVNEKDRDVIQAKKAALAWLALADAGKFEATWVEAAGSFQKAQTKAAWAKGFGEA